MNKLTLAFSPCPNDTFIFDAMVHQKIDTEGLEFDYSMTDVEELNKMAFAKSIDVTKISFHAFVYLTKDYILLESGSALGNNVGPVLIAKKNYSPEALQDIKIAIPGEYTTANLLLKILFPTLQNKTSMLFSDIEDAVLSEKVDAGLIIHENRFTYKARGLHKIVDLGELWMEKTGVPIPLGGIIASKDLSPDTIKKLNRVLRRSILFAMKNPESGMDFIKRHSNEMDAEIIKKHIELYVNNYTVELGEEGHKAIERLITLTKE
ncbi:MAG: 1,4-dihydroxy-6-naphthoate synthase [Bacteroidales bacterium]|nr:1,4-dihydroxy-6-naphthoate synthase [Bacteroidales bacterium]